MHGKNIIRAGLPVNEAGNALIMLHGRGGYAEDILMLSEHLNLKSFAILAPQATGNTWYPYSFLAPLHQNAQWLGSALNLIMDIMKDLNNEGIATDRIFLLGFSQGACLALEFAARHPERFGGVVGFSGGLIGDRIYTENYGSDLEGTPVFLGSSDPDPHIPVERVHATAEILQKMNARPTVKIYKGMGHTVSREEIDSVNEIIFS